MSAGKIALEETAKKFADMTATEVTIGFGDLFCDHRSPLSQVEVFKTGEKPLNEKAAALLEEAKALHNKTKGKKALDKKFYGIEDKETEEDITATPDTPETVIEESNNDSDNANTEETTESTTTTPDVETTSTETDPPTEPVVESTQDPEPVSDPNQELEVPPSETTDTGETDTTDNSVDELMDELNSLLNDGDESSDNPPEDPDQPIEP